MIQAFRSGWSGLLLEPWKQDIVFQVHVVFQIRRELRETRIKAPPRPTGMPGRREPLGQGRQTCDVLSMAVVYNRSRMLESTFDQDGIDADEALCRPTNDMEPTGADWRGG